MKRRKSRIIPQLMRQDIKITPVVWANIRLKRGNVVGTKKTPHLLWVININNKEAVTSKR